MKWHLNNGLQPQLFFWRDKNGHEIDCLLKKGEDVFAFEIKSGQTIATNFFSELKYWQQLTGVSSDKCSLIYGGLESQRRMYGSVYAWAQLTNLFEHLGNNIANN